MIDKWFLEDIQKSLKNTNRLVFIDEGGNADFLRRLIPSGYILKEANNEIEELKAKYETEKSHKDQPVIFYTNTPQTDLKYLREYCETGSVLEIKYLKNYIQKKVLEHLDLNLSSKQEELIPAAKLSIGKDQTYWMKLGKGLGDIFDLEKDLVPFFHEPKKYIKKFDKDVRDQFLQKVNALTGKAFVSKPPETLAKEVVHHLFDSLLKNRPDKLLLNVYHQWLDSRSYSDSFKKYLDKYELPKSIDPWSVHPDHPFAKLDEIALLQLVKKMGDKSYIGSILPKINQRAVNKYAQSLGVDFWQHIKTLLDFDAKNINYLSSSAENIDFYTKYFYKVDRAIRKLYTEFLNNEEIIRPIQEFYESLNSILLDKWFRFLKPYQQNQVGLIQKLIEQNPPKVAIIVGDGVSYEIAKGIEANLSKDFRIKDDFILSNYPSETENNMSNLYVASGEVMKIHKKREAYLVENCDQNIRMIQLSDVNESTTADYLICTFKDVDSLGEKMQQNALKFYDTTEKDLENKIGVLLKNGFKKVFLVADHGFVLTGLLSESDKIEVQFTGKVTKSERYIRTVEKQNAGDSFVEMPGVYKEFKHLYFSKATKPFKTPGVYGFSHGGLTPQELITPCFCFESSAKEEKLEITIQNKSDLKSVTGDLFTLKLKAEKSGDNLFTVQRKCHLLFFSNNKSFYQSDEFILMSGVTFDKEFSFDGKTEIDVILLDAESKEQIDTVSVKKDNARDMGGLL